MDDRPIHRVAGHDLNAEPKPSIVFTVDVEDWGQSVFDRSLPISRYCADNVRRLLDILATDPGARGTFFVLGKFAQKHPQVVRDLQATGHEIASHGFGHEPVHHQTPGEFRDDLRRAADIISHITAQTVVGYRAPVFSIGQQNLWALEVLADEGYEYDSSIFPIAGRRYGIPHWPREPATIRLGHDRRIIEFPLTAVRIAGRNYPVSGGGYARLIPSPLLIRAFQREARHRRTSWPVFYCHPYELDAREFQRRDPTPPWGDRHLPLTLQWHQGVGRGAFERKLRALMHHFQFRSFAQARRSLAQPPEMSIRVDEPVAIPVD